MSDYITITKEDWRNIRTVMRDLTWGDHKNMGAWGKVVDSVESRIKTDEHPVLKPCPFCGSDGERSIAIAGMGGCAESFGCGVCDVWFYTIDRWNDRG